MVPLPVPEHAGLVRVNRVVLEWYWSSARWCLCRCLSTRGWLGLIGGSCSGTGVVLGGAVAGA